MPESRTFSTVFNLSGAEVDEGWNIILVRHDEKILESLVLGAGTVCSVRTNKISAALKSVTLILSLRVTSSSVY